MATLLCACVAAVKTCVIDCFLLDSFRVCVVAHFHVGHRRSMKPLTSFQFTVCMYGLSPVFRVVTKAL